MPAGASEGGYTSGTMTGASDYTSTHHDPQIQCSEKKGKRPLNPTLRRLK